MLITYFLLVTELKKTLHADSVDTEGTWVMI